MSIVPINLFKESSREDVISLIKKERQEGDRKTEELLQIMPLSELVQMTGFSDKVLAAKCRAQAELLEGRQKSIVEKKVKTIFSRIFSEVTTFFTHIVDTLLKSLGVYEIGKGSIADWDAASRLSVYSTILSYPAVVFLALNKWLTPPVALAATAIIVAATFVAFAVYMKFLKPCPKTLAGFTNLTQEASRGQLEPVFGRDAEIADLINTLQNKQGVLLLGASGVGKSEVIKGLAQMIANGEAGSLNGKELFSINAVDALFSLRQAEEALKGHEKDVIIFVDELVSAWKDKKQSFIDNLKTFIDNFPHFAAASTEQDYQKYGMGEDSSIARRLQIKKIEPMATEHIKVVLSSIVESESKSLFLERDAMDHLLKNAPKGRPEPATSKGVINRAIKCLDNDPLNGLDNKIARVNQKIEVVQRQFCAGQSDSLVTVEEAIHKIQKLKSERQQLEKTKAKQQVLLAEVKKVRAEWHKVKGQLLSANITSEILSEAHRDWIVKSFFVLPALEQRIYELAASKELKGIKTVIDKKLIDSCFQQ